MDEETRDKLNLLYSLITNIHQANVQILKNQRHLMQQNIIKPSDFQSPKILIEETDNTLKTITGDKG